MLDQFDEQTIELEQHGPSEPKMLEFNEPKQVLTPSPTSPTISLGALNFISLASGASQHEPHP